MPLPKEPKTPATLQMLRWVFGPMPYMEECAKTDSHVFTLKLQNNLLPLVFIHTPEVMQHFLSKDTKELRAPGELNNIFEIY
jgi:hypothetical protein